MVEVHLAVGNWERAAEAVWLAKRMWIEREDGDEIPSDDSALRASHIAILKLDPRTINQIEAVCSGTVGSLIDCFPEGFVRVSGIGVKTIETIADELCRIGAITKDRARKLVSVFSDCRIINGKQ